MNNCGRCGQHTSGLHLCEQCSAAVVRALTLFAPLVADLRAMMTDLHATPTDLVRVDGTRERPLGADFTLAGRADALYSTVANWAVGWSLALNATRPQPIERYGQDETVTGVPRTGPAFLAARRISSWLIGHHSTDNDGRPGIDSSPDAGLYAVEIIDAITAEAVAIGYRPRARRVPDRLCRVCDSATLRHTWPLNGQPKLTCTACGEVAPCGPNLTRAVLATA